MPTGITGSGRTEGSETTISVILRCIAIGYPSSVRAATLGFEVTPSGVVRIVDARPRARLRSCASLAFAACSDGCVVGGGMLVGLVSLTSDCASSVEPAEESREVATRVPSLEPAP